MTNLFIDIEVDPKVARNSRIAGTLSEVCPVDIFNQNGSGELEIVSENLDECVLCRLCLDVSPQGSVVIRKLYDSGAEL